MRINEKHIQIGLYDTLNVNWQRAYPNLYAYDWESDLLVVTKHGYDVEYEIKVSYADFRADFNKAEKHSILRFGKPGTCPAKFMYVVPYGLVNSQDIPDYAGYTEWRFDGRNLYFDVIKKAPFIHKIKISDSRIRDFDKRLYYKYWSLMSKVDFG